MNITILLAIILLLGATGGKLLTRRSGSIRYIGSDKVVYGGLIKDYDYRVQVDGFTKAGKPLTAYSGNARYHGGDTWGFHNPPEKIFKIAWDNYLAQGGDPSINWAVTFDPSFYSAAKKDERYDSMLGLLNIFFPQLRTTIENAITSDVREDIEIIINA